MKKVTLPKKKYLGIEFGSTRIKAVLVNDRFETLAQGAYQWENRLENGLWTYALCDVWTGLSKAYQSLANQVLQEYGAPLTGFTAMGVSAMMHGYLPFDENDQLLVPFRTWRNTNTFQAAKELSGQLHFNFPQRWSASHLYQAILNKEEHVGEICFLTTLAGYVHWQLTGQKVLGIGDASGMFPVEGNQYDSTRLSMFDKMTQAHGFHKPLLSLLPKIRLAGESAGCLTEQGARLLDPTGVLQPGSPVCPPEGDAGTGMVATNSVEAGTGNISAGTSIFAMVALSKPLSHSYPELDLVATPDGKPVAMVHCNNCTSDLNAWMRLITQASAALGGKTDEQQVYETLINTALSGDKDCGGLLSYNCVSGEPVIGLDSGCPMFLRAPDAPMTLPNFMRAQLYSTMTALKTGMDLLTQGEKVGISCLTGHGGLFKTKGVMQQLMAGALNVPVFLMQHAGEGGPWGMALLASFSTEKEDMETLGEYLKNRVFKNTKGELATPDKEDVAGFEEYQRRFIACLPIEKAAAERKEGK